MSDVPRAVISNKPSTAAGVDIVVGRNRRGEWLAVEQHGFCGGIFVTREDALRYAASQAARPASEIRVVSAPIELRI